MNYGEVTITFGKPSADKQQPSLPRYHADGTLVLTNYIHPENHDLDVWENSSGRQVTGKQFHDAYGPGSMDAICEGGWRRISSHLDPKARQE